MSRRLAGAPPPPPIFRRLAAAVVPVSKLSRLGFIGKKGKKIPIPSAVSYAPLPAYSSSLQHRVYHRRRRIAWTEETPCRRAPFCRDGDGDEDGGPRGRQGPSDGGGPRLGGRRGRRASRLAHGALRGTLVLHGGRRGLLPRRVRRAGARAAGRHRGRQPRRDAIRRARHHLQVVGY